MYPTPLTKVRTPPVCWAGTRTDALLLLSAVNQLKAVVTARAWNEASAFDEEKDKTQFRQYEDACDRVKNFYKEQHGR